MVLWSGSVLGSDARLRRLFLGGCESSGLGGGGRLGSDGCDKVLGLGTVVKIGS